MNDDNEENAAGVEKSADATPVGSTEIDWSILDGQPTPDGDIDWSILDSQLQRAQGDIDSSILDSEPSPDDIDSSMLDPEPTQWDDIDSGILDPQPTPDDIQEEQEREPEVALDGVRSTALVPVVGIDLNGVDPDLARLLVNAFDWLASDLHLNVGRPPVFRIDGKLVDDAFEPDLDIDVITRMLRSVIDDERWEVLKTRRQVDFSVTLPNVGRFRVNAYYKLGALSAAFRTISNVVPTAHEIGVPPDVERVASYPYGLVLFVGPTGSGKSTTQAALLGGINTTRPCHIVTIEDPVEYLHQRSVAVVSQREVGSDVMSFADGLRAALREDPDVILVGEMRDQESIAITLTLAETGHLVFATLHTNDAAQAIDRIIDSYPADSRDQIQTQLSAALQAVVSQRLVLRVGGGRIAAFEVMLANDAVRNLIREGKTRQLRNILTTSSNEGMRTMESSLNVLVTVGDVDYQEAISVSQYPKEIKDPAVATVIATMEQAAGVAPRS